MAKSFQVYTFWYNVDIDFIIQHSISLHIQA